MKSRQKHFFMILNCFAFLLIVTMSNFALIYHVHFLPWLTTCLFYSFFMHKLLLRLSIIYVFIVIVLQQENRIQEHCLIEFGLQASLAWRSWNMIVSHAAQRASVALLLSRLEHRPSELRRKDKDKDSTIGIGSRPNADTSTTPCTSPFTRRRDSSFARLMEWTRQRQFFLTSTNSTRMWCLTNAWRFIYRVWNTTEQGLTMFTFLRTRFLMTAPTPSQ